MKITSENERCIAVELTNDDMKKLDITYEALDYSNIETRRVLWTLLDEARRISGRNISLADRLMIETIPSGEGGCIILFTSIPNAEGKPRERFKLQNTLSPIVCDFDNVNDMLDFCGKSACREWASTVTIYENNGIYRAVIRPELADREKVKAIAAEFGQCRSMRTNLLTVQTAEYWKPISLN